MTRKRIELHDEKDAEQACASGASLARRLGFDAMKKACLTLAIRELTQEALRRHSKRMACLICDESDQQSIRVRVALSNDGPGILISSRRENGHAR